MKIQNSSMSSISLFSGIKAENKASCACKPESRPPASSIPGHLFCAYLPHFKSNSKSDSMSNSEIKHLSFKEPPYPDSINEPYAKVCVKTQGSHYIINDIKAKSLSAEGYARIGNVEANEVKVTHFANVDSITANKVTLSSFGTAGVIYLTGNDNNKVSIYDFGKVTGNIIFDDKGGKVLLYGDKEGNYPQINPEQVINGSIEIIKPKISECDYDDTPHLDDFEHIDSYYKACDEYEGSGKTSHDPDWTAQDSDEHKWNER